MQCSHCGKEISDTAKVCGYCGHKQNVLPPNCPNCGKDVREGAKVCGYCGHKFAAIAPTPTPEPAPHTEKEKAEPPPSKPEPELPKKEVPPVQEEPKQAPPPKEESKPEPKPVVPQPGSEPKPETEHLVPPPPPKTKGKIKLARVAKGEPGAPPKPKRKKFIWVWSLVGVVIIAISLGYLYTQGFLTNAPFDGAIGMWTSRDPGDGSRQTLSIYRTLDGKYKVTYQDEEASVCGGAPANGSFIAGTSTSTIVGFAEIVCDKISVVSYPPFTAHFQLTKTSRNVLTGSGNTTWLRQP